MAGKPIDASSQPGQRRREWAFCLVGNGCMLNSFGEMDRGYFLRFNDIVFLPSLAMRLFSLDESRMQTVYDAHFKRIAAAWESACACAFLRSNRRSFYDNPENNTPHSFRSEQYFRTCD